MLQHNTSRQTRGASSVDYARTAAKMLQEIADATNAPYVNGVAGVSLLILDTVQVCLYSHR